MGLQAYQPTGLPLFKINYARNMPGPIPSRLPEGVKVPVFLGHVQSACNQRSSIDSPPT